MESDKILLAVSGGLDSVVMARLFSQSPYRFAIAHVNFGLRAEESEADALFVETLARELKVPFYTTHLPAAQQAEAAGISVQMAARDLRYQWFEKLLQQEAYDYVATAHHLNDLTETMLLNLSRGTGLPGLHGIAPKRAQVVRPLLFATRQALEGYARELHIRWREDSSNRSLKYRRNNIRQQVIPLLKALNPRLEETFLETARQVRAAENLLKDMANRLRREIVEEREGHAYMQLPRLLEEGEPRYLLGALLQPYGGGWREAGAILQTWRQPQGTISGKWFSTSTHRIVLDREQLVISPLAATAIAPLTLSPEEQALPAGPYVVQTRRLKASNYTLPKDPAIAALDFAKLHFPLLLRQPRPGDWFVPLGMQGKKKLSDFMIDRKIPVNLKEEILVLVSGESIAWVAGHRPDNRFKVTPETTEIFEIRLLKPDNKAIKP
ncbi:MAG: tRNA lysidine(34) synthetase TilS [Bacteroidetes bacterium]|nr:tRNA lysidine(34) synthetase TilS [Bacteroidota bacterium]